MKVRRINNLDYNTALILKFKHIKQHIVFSFVVFNRDSIIYPRCGTVVLHGQKKEFVYAQAAGDVYRHIKRDMDSLELSALPVNEINLKLYIKEAIIEADNAEPTDYSFLGKHYDSGIFLNAVDLIINDKETGQIW